MKKRRRDKREGKGLPIGGRVQERKENRGMMNKQEEVGERKD